MALCPLFGCVVLLDSWQCLSSRFPPGWFPWEWTPSSCLCLYFLDLCLVVLLGISEDCLSQTRHSFVSVCVCVCMYVEEADVCVRITEESVAILTKPSVKIRAWLSPCVSLLNRLIALLYELLIAWAHVSWWASWALWIWHFFCVHTLYLFQCVFMYSGFLYMYISLGLFMLCLFYCLYCVSCWLSANLTGAQPSKLTNLSPNDLLVTPVSCSVIGSSYTVSASSSDAATAF